MLSLEDRLIIIVCVRLRIDNPIRMPCVCYSIGLRGDLQYHSVCYNRDMNSVVCVRLRIDNPIRMPCVL